MRYCTNCGAPADGIRRFCTTCGSVLRQAPASDTLTAAPGGVPSATDTTPPAGAGAPPMPAGPPAPPPGPPTVVTQPGSWPAAQAHPSDTAEPPTVVTPAGSRPLAPTPANSPPEPPTVVTAPRSWPPAQTPANGRPERPPVYVPPPTSWPPAPAPSEDHPPAGPPPPEPPYPPRSGRSAAWIGFTVVAVVLLAGGGFAGWRFFGQHTTQHPGPATAPSSAVNQVESGSPGSPVASTPTPPATTPATSPAPSGPAGSFAVAVAPAAAQQPGEPQVVSFLQSYFTAINDHDYRQYAPLVTASQRPTPQEFQNGFGSSTDSHARLTGLVPTATGVAATVKFTSHQSPSASPTGTSCNSWRITLFLQPHGAGYRIGPAAPGYHAHFRAC